MLFLSSGESRGTRAERPLESFGNAASNDCRDASPVVPTDPPQAEGNDARSAVRYNSSLAIFRNLCLFEDPIAIAV